MLNLLVSKPSSRMKQSLFFFIDIQSFPDVLFPDMASMHKFEWLNSVFLCLQNMIALLLFDESSAESKCDDAFKPKISHALGTQDYFLNGYESQIHNIRAIQLLRMMDSLKYN